MGCAIKLLHNNIFLVLRVLFNVHHTSHAGRICILLPSIPTSSPTVPKCTTECHIHVYLRV